MIKFAKHNLSRRIYLKKNCFVLGLVRLSEESFQVVEKILNWKEENRFPALDLLRYRYIDTYRQIEMIKPEGRKQVHSSLLSLYTIQSSFILFRRHKCLHLGDTDNAIVERITQHLVANLGTGRKIDRQKDIQKDRLIKRQIDKKID